MHETFGARLKRLRLAAKLSRTKLAASANLSERYVHMLEAGERLEPRAATIAGLADALGVSMDLLWHGAEAEDRLARRRADAALREFDRVAITEKGRAALGVRHG